MKSTRLAKITLIILLITFRSVHQLSNMTLKIKAKCSRATEIGKMLKISETSSKLEIYKRSLVISPTKNSASTTLISKRPWDKASLELFIRLFIYRPKLFML